jgi:hypothetical protein
MLEYKLIEVLLQSLVGVVDAQLQNEQKHHHVSKQYNHTNYHIPVRKN